MIAVFRAGIGTISALQNPAGDTWHPRSEGEADEEEFEIPNNDHLR